MENGAFESGLNAQVCCPFQSNKPVFGHSSYNILGNTFVFFFQGRNGANGIFPKVNINTNLSRNPFDRNRRP